MNDIGRILLVTKVKCRSWPLASSQGAAHRGKYRKLPDSLNGIAKPRNFVKNLGRLGSRLVVNKMVRGLYLIGNKREGRVRAVQIVDRAGNSTTLRLKHYMSRKIHPGYTALPWQQDFMLQENDSKATKQTADTRYDKLMRRTHVTPACKTR
jgi:hypothetical protein